MELRIKKYIRVYKLKFFIENATSFTLTGTKTYSFRESTDGVDTLDIFADVAKNKHKNISYNLQNCLHSYQIVSNKSILCNNEGLSCHIKSLAMENAYCK